MAGFPQFSDPRCSLEIQDLIWKHAIAAIPPRIVQLAKVKEVTDTIYAPGGSLHLVDVSFSSSAPIPVVLHVCSRSRKLAKERWSLTFHTQQVTHGSNVRNRVLSLNGVPRTWVDFESDTLLFLEHGPTRSPRPKLSLGEFLQETRSETMKQVRNIAVSLMGMERGDDLQFGGFGDDLVYKEMSVDIENSLPQVRKVSIAFKRLSLRDMMNIISGIPDQSGPVRKLRLIPRGNEGEEIVLEIFRKTFKEKRGERVTEINKVELVFNLFFSQV